VPLPCVTFATTLVMKAEPLAAVHGHAAFESVTVTLPDPADVPTLAFVGVSDATQPDACVTVNV